MSRRRPENLITLREILTEAERGQYAVGSFSPRCLPLIQPILRAAQDLASPVIVQISQIEFDRYKITAEEFAAKFYELLEAEKITVPVVLHLDHTWELAVIQEAIAAGFTSVMIDASKLPLEENIAATRSVVEYSLPHNVSVEAELGRIGTSDFIETDTDEELYTEPEEAQGFVKETGVDALAVSVGTSHGVYKVRQPKIDYARLDAIRQLTSVHLVLHGGSGVPASMLHQAIARPQGGISKVNIATDLELAFLEAVGSKERLTNQECMKLPSSVLVQGQAAVEAVVRSKMQDFVCSAGKAEVEG